MRKLLISGAVLFLLLACAFLLVREPDIARTTLEAKYGGKPSQFITLPDGTRAHVRDRGPRAARALVLIHGSNASLFTWEPWAKQLSDTFRVITVDLPGHGLTGAVPNGDYSQEGMLKFMEAVTDALGLETFAIGGNSMGGRVELLFTLEHPSRTTHLVLVDSGGVPTKQVDPESFAFQLIRMPVINDEMVDRYWDFVRMKGTREATIARVNIRDKRIKDRINSIKVPTLILWGE